MSLSRMFLAAQGLIAAVVVAAGGATDEPPASATFKLPAKAEVGATLDQLARTMLLPRDPWQPRAAEEKARGASAAVYPKVAPAVVVVRAGRGHGTGFFVGPEGWLVTNHHVIADAGFDPATGVRIATVHLGQLQDGLMKLQEQGIPAQVYKSSEEKDLALLKLTRLPPGVKSVPVVSVAKQVPLPGSDCVAIGHPAAALLWSVRSGEVSGVGNWPHEMIDVVMQRLALTAADRDRVGDMIKSAPKRKVVVSSLGLNPGDSGGPLVNGQGELVAVSFAVPKSLGPVRVDKFSYHVHLDEVKAFLADRPKTPQTPLPDPWPAGLYSAILDLDDDGKPDTIAFSMEPGRPLTGFVLDLDQDSRRITPAMLIDKDQRKAWDFEFAYQGVGTARTFYDADNDGEIDLILTDANQTGRASHVMRRVRGAWIHEEGKGQRLFEPSLFTDRALRERFQFILRKLVGQ